MTKQILELAVREAKEACWQYFCGRGTTGSVILYNEVRKLSHYLFFKDTPWST